MISLDSLINSLDEALLVFDRDGSVMLINKAGEELFGKSLKDLTRRHIGDLFAGAEDIVLLLQKTINEGRAFSSREVEVVLGRNVNVDLNLSPLYHDGRLEGAILTMRENLSLTARGDEQFDALLYLLGSIAHEIKNPLSGVKGAAQILKRDVTHPETVECADLILKEVDRLNSVLQGYLTMTRKPVFNQLNIHEVIEYALRVMDAVIEEKRILVEKSYDPSLPHISGDESKLLQVFINLLKNAAESMDGAKRTRVLTIATRPSDEYMVIYEKRGPSKRPARPTKQRWLVITIQDTGKGIPRETQGKIFLPFFTNKTGGSGLGLAVSKKIIKDHGGTIKVKSAVGSGTALSVYLPYRKQVSSQPAQA